MKKKIMYVDTSASALESFKWVLKDEPYHLIAFKSPLEALKAIEEAEFCIVIADQTMPEMDGLEFLKGIKEKSPNTATIAMYAYLETDEAIKALRNGYVFQFIKKPFDKRRIKQAMELAEDYYQINVETRKLLPFKDGWIPPKL